MIRGQGIIHLSPVDYQISKTTPERPDVRQTEFFRTQRRSPPSLTLQSPELDLIAFAGVFLLCKLLIFRLHFAEDFLIEELVMISSLNSTPLRKAHIQAHHLLPLCLEATASSLRPPFLPFHVILYRQNAQSMANLATAHWFAILIRDNAWVITSLVGEFPSSRRQVRPTAWRASSLRARLPASAASDPSHNAS